MQENELYTNIKDLLIELVKIPSLSNTAQEKEIGDFILNKLSRLDYFKANPDNIFFKKIKNDPHQRGAIAALLNKGESNKTIIFVNHYDVVDTLDYGKYKNLAFKPETLTEKYKEIGIYDQIIDRFKDNDMPLELLFGRGVSDMKAGLAVELIMLDYLSKNQDFKGNILFLSVPDEENTSLGMLTAVELLVDLKSKLDLEYIAAINTEPTFPAYPGDNSRYIYTGSLGKAVMFFYGVGLETHAGDVLSGLNGNLIISDLINELEANILYSDRIEDYVAPPPTCLKMRDYKRHYSAQIPHTSAAYINFCLVKDNAADLMKIIKQLTLESVQKVESRIDKNFREYAKIQGFSAEEKSSKAWAYSFEEFLTLAQKNSRDKVNQIIKELVESNQDIEVQELCLLIVDKINDYVNFTGPGIVYGFTPPYYPPVLADENSKYDKKILEITEDLIEESARYGYEVKTSSVFPGISDLSYFKLNDLAAIKNSLAANLPVWESKYNLPLKAMAELDIPVMNLSMHGFDAHKHTECLELNYSLKVVPYLLKKAAFDLIE